MRCTHRPKLLLVVVSAAAVLGAAASALAQAPPPSPSPDPVAAPASPVPAAPASQAPPAAPAPDPNAAARPADAQATTTTPPPKPPPFVMVKAGEDTFFRLGLLLQSQADYLQDASGDEYAQNYFIRRIRVIVGGQLVKDVSFFFETDSPNTGKTLANGKAGSSLTVQDAFVEWKISNAFQLGGGLFLVPLARNTLQSAASLYTLDYGSYSFLFSSPLQNVVGRDEGFQARGYLAQNRFEYRVGLFQGQRDAASHQEARLMARVLYNVLDPEVGFFYAGTNFGKKKVLAFGAAIDSQRDYRAYAADAFLDHPVGNNVLTVQGDFIRYDGGDTFLTLPKQDTFHSEAGVYISKVKVAPYALFEAKDVAGRDAGDEKRYGAGLSWFAKGHNFNVKLLYLRIDPKVGNSQNEFCMQMQGFFF